MEVQGRRKRGRPKRRQLNRARYGIKGKGLSGEEVYGRATWRRTSTNIDPTQMYEYDEEVRLGNTIDIFGVRNTRVHHYKHNRVCCKLPESIFIMQAHCVH